MGPIRGQTRMLPVDVGVEPAAQRLDTKLNASIHNRFDVEVVDAMTGEVKQRAQAENVICNQLWTRLLAPNTYFNYIHYGTGSGTPAAANTSLFTFLGYGTPSTSDDVYTYKWTDGYISLRRKIQLSELTAVGSTLTEVGIGYSTSSASLCTHAMLKDMNGNTISIAKTSTDIINIYATVFVHWATTGYDSGNISIIPFRGNTLLTGLFGVTALSSATVETVFLYAGGTVLDLYAIPSANRYYQQYNTVAFSAANKTITITCQRISAANGNIGGAGCVHIGRSDNMGYLRLKAGSTGIPSAAITGEAIATGNGTTKDFATAFPFISGAKVYCDGVLQTSGITIEENVPLLYNKMGLFFELVSVSSTTAFRCNPEQVPRQESVADDIDFSINATCVWYNPHYSLGITSFVNPSSLCKVEISDDLSTWVTLGTTSGPVTVDAAYRNYKYWRFTKTGSGEYYSPNTFTTAGCSNKNIHFSTPPAVGAVITADYTTKTIAKDANHVFDFSMTIQLGEHTT